MDWDSADWQRVCQTGECPEIAFGDREVALRDSSDPAMILVITREAFNAMRAMPVPPPPS